MFNGPTTMRAVRRPTLTDGDPLNEKPAAFNSSSPRFEDEKQKGHNRAKTKAGLELIKPVYELQLLEGPQARARQVLNSANPR